MDLVKLHNDLAHKFALESAASMPQLTANNTLTVVGERTMRIYAQALAYYVQTFHSEIVYVSGQGVDDETSF
jgi:hypothetical protein